MAVVVPALSLGDSSRPSMLVLLQQRSMAKELKDREVCPGVAVR